MRATFRLLARICCAIVFVFAALLIPMSASSQELRGKITGRVVDANGSPVSGASVKVTDVCSAAISMLTTHADGLFAATYLRPGGCQVLVEATRCKKALRDRVEVAINETSTLAIPLDVGTIQETVTVTSDTAQ